MAQSIIRLFGKSRGFGGSESYWTDRYRRGGNSGAGSYGHLASYKARVVNEFVEVHAVAGVIEFGCGDGNQLRSMVYPAYLGLDVSRHAIDLCATVFGGDRTKSFKLVGEYAGETADLAVSLDVIYHLVELETYQRYLKMLFGAGTRFVVIYSSNMDAGALEAPHILHRQFSRWVSQHEPEWRLLDHLLNPFPKEETCADFYFYEKVPASAGDPRATKGPL